MFPTDGVNSGSTDIVGKQKEIWPQVIEKAYAESEGGYGDIANGGWPFIAMQPLTGKDATMYSPTFNGGLTLAKLASFANNNDLICFDTGSGPMPYGLIASHSYGFAGTTGTGAKAAG